MNLYHPNNILETEFHFTDAYPSHHIFENYAFDIFPVKLNFKQ